MIINLHLKGALGTEIGFEYFLEALGSVDVDAQGGGLTHDVSLSVDKLEGRHTFV